MLGALGCITPELLAQQGVSVSCTWCKDLSSFLTCGPGRRQEGAEECLILCTSTGALTASLAASWGSQDIRLTGHAVWGAHLVEGWRSDLLFRWS